MPLKPIKQMPKRLLIQIRVDNEQKKILVEAAKRAGLGLSAWIRGVALREAGHIGVS